ncbi:MAG TPA: Uma2 family endonuclease [Bryobacteraceae bacterium]|jgi:Uma2 family endonuclease
MSTRALTSRPFISVEEYLASSYRPDCDYVDGHIEERNLGERTHGRIQGRLMVLLAGQAQEGAEVLPEVRVQVKPSRFRIPDVCIALNDSDDPILTKPPFLCIEVLSPEDRMSRIEARIKDYVEMGALHVWVLNPQTKQAYVATADGLSEVKTGVLSTGNPTFEVQLAEVFR